MDRSTSQSKLWQKILIPTFLEVRLVDTLHIIGKAIAKAAEWCWFHLPVRNCELCDSLPPPPRHSSEVQQFSPQGCVSSLELPKPFRLLVVAAEHDPAEFKRQAEDYHKVS